MHKVVGAQSIISPLQRQVILMVADGWLHGQNHLVDLSQMTEVNPHVSERFLAELTAQGAAWAYLRVVKLHVGA